MIDTPWGHIEVADAHVHFFSHRFFTLMAAQKGADLTAQDVAAVAGWNAPPHEPIELAAQWTEELDRYGVQRAALIASLPGDEDSVLSAIKAFPDRFIAYFIVNPLATGAVETTQRTLDSGARAIALFPAMHRYRADDPAALAVIDCVAARPGCAVFVHTGVLTVGIRRKLGLPSPFDMRFSNPIDLHAVALRYPSVPFIIPSFGAGYFREVLMLGDLCPNIYLDTSSSNSWTRYHTETLNLAGVFRRALNVVGPERLLFGTDSSFMPRGWNISIFEDQVAALQAIGARPPEISRIFAENFNRLFPLNC